MQVVDKTISVSEAQQDLEAIVLDVAAKNHEVILEIDGEPKAVVIPISLHRQFNEQRRQSRRQALLDKMRAAAERANMTEEEAEELIEEAIKAVRNNKG